MSKELLDRITIEPEKCSGHPSIRGMRLRVSHVLGMVAAGMSIEEFVTDYPDLEPDDVKASLLYAAQIVDKQPIAA